MSRGGARDREVWERYSGDRDALRAEVGRIRGGESRAPSPRDRVRVTSGPIEQVHAESFDYQSPARDVNATARERQLVTDFEAYLVSQGHVVGRHSYQIDSSARPLANDLFDETARTLYEAKADVSRSDLRMAIGQLFDYRRFETEPEGLRLSVLLPRRPSDDLVALLRDLEIGVAYRTRDGFDLE